MRAFAALLVAWIGLLLPAHAEVPHPPLEAYGELPDIRAGAVSPDGAHVAFLVRRDGRDVVLLFSIETKKSSAVAVVDKIAARGLFFADNTHLILIVSDTARQVGFKGRWEDSAAYSIDIATKRMQPLLRRTEDLYPAQTGLGTVLGRNRKEPVVYMPAYSGEVGADPDYNLFAVNLNTGKGRAIGRGRTITTDWIVDSQGNVLAREDYSNARDNYQIWSGLEGKLKLIYETDADVPPYSLIGVNPGKTALIVVDETGTDEEYSALYELDAFGNLSAPIFGRDDADIERIYLDDNRLVEGVRYTGAMPSYDFFDPEIDAAVRAMTEKYPGARVEPVSRSDGWKQILYLVFDGTTAGSYILQDRVNGTYAYLATVRKTIPAEAIGEVALVDYAARDGLQIPGILTFPAGSTAETRKNLPLVVMPHGGPSAYDDADFDWEAQYFANRGYLVLQPNFRGSAGYGAAFERAGYGEWGQKMQDDISDGVLALSAAGMADPGRVCIVGASYGGYAALAGGAFTPELYKCVAAIAPVSDVARMIRDEKAAHGRKHWVVDYWERLIGDPRAEADKLAQISPVNFADAFRAPVLLIHGRDDTTVPVSQSRIMESALKQAGKQVTLVEMKGEDHWLSDGDTRTAALRAMGDFVDANIGQK